MNESTLSGIRLLFAYGTLGPAGSGVVSLEGWTVDAVRGRLFDLGPYPALIDAGDPQFDWVEGHVREVTLEELEGPLDEYEGVAQGLYRRIVVATRAGRWAWVYEYDRPIPGDARGPLVRWRNG